jgi:hypothetical protein
MRVSRGKLLVLLSAALIMPVGGAAVFSFFYALPNPENATRQELFFCLIERDLTRESPQTRLLFANRLQELCNKDFDWHSVKVKLNDTQQARAWKNISSLLQPWFLDKAVYYGNLEPEKRLEFIDHLIDVLSAWQGVENLLPNRLESADNRGVSAKLSDIVHHDIDKMITESDSPEREQIGELWNALKMRWLLRCFSSRWGV